MKSKSNDVHCSSHIYPQIASEADLKYLFLPLKILNKFNKQRNRSKKIESSSSKYVCECVIFLHS